MNRKRCEGFMPGGMRCIFFRLGAKLLDAGSFENEFPLDVNAFSGEISSC